MSAALEIIDPTEYRGWNGLIDSIPAASFFLTSNWARVLKESYSYRPLYFVGFEGSKASAVVPMMEVKSRLTSSRGVSIPFTDYCDPFVSDSKAFSEVLEELADYGRKAGWKYIEFRGRQNYLDGMPPYTRFAIHTLTLDSNETALFNKLLPNVRRNIHKAERMGIRVDIYNSIESIESYYRLHCLTRKRHGAPPQPKWFFDALYRHAIANGKGFTALARYRGRVVAGAIYVHSYRNGIFKYGASDYEYQLLRANNLVMWEAIKWFSANGFSELSLGRTDLDNTGLIRFKEGWGAVGQQVCYHRYDLRHHRFTSECPDTTARAMRVFRRFPVSLLRIIGTLLYRHIG